jgi:hypothetical protein
MDNRFNVILLALALALASGCKKSEAPQPPPPSTPSASTSAVAANDVIARVHWLGKDQIEKDPNAAALMKIWQTPESDRLEAQTLEKLSRAPWRLLLGDDKATNSANALFAPIVSDLLQAESYLEIAQGTNQPAEIAFAIRLKEDRARLWEKNLAGVVESLTGKKASPVQGAGWQIQFSTSLSTLNSQPSTNSKPSTITLGRSGEWTIVTAGRDGNGLLTEFQARIKRDRTPFGPHGNGWIDAEFDLRRLNEALGLGWKLPENAPIVSADVFADKENVRTHADLAFPKSLTVNLDPWNVPTNLIQGPIYGLTIARSIAPLLEKLQLFAAVHPEPVPNQVYLWDSAKLPFKSYFAFPASDPTNLFHQLAPQIQAALTPRLSRAYGAISINTTTHVLTWTGLPFATPFFEVPREVDGRFLLGGFGPHLSTRTNRMPAELLDHILTGTNLVYLDWEITAERLVHWRYLDDVARITFDAAHASRLGEQTASMQWVANDSTNLSYAFTELKQFDARHLTFTRKSTIGLTALEIDVLANWLELPEFPHGLDTWLKTNPEPARIWQRLHRAPPGEPK